MLKTIIIAGRCDPGVPRRASHPCHLYRAVAGEGQDGDSPGGRHQRVQEAG